jgi:uncharacterized protein YeaO (DUF488 family)
VDRPARADKAARDEAAIASETAMTKSQRSLDVRVRRVYEEPAASDGTRVLVDRIWPRGVRKADAALAHWFRDVAPSDALRRWFGHDPRKWDEFQRRYTEELKAREAASEPELAELRRLAGAGPLTLLYGAHDETHNQAVVLRDVLLRGSRGGRHGA